MPFSILCQRSNAAMGSSHVGRVSKFECGHAVAGLQPRFVPCAPSGGIRRVPR